MTIEEASGQFGIPIKILREYEQMNLCGTGKQYGEQDLRGLSMLMTLHDIGFSAKDTHTYMQLLLTGENEEKCLKMLNQKRKKTLDKIHFYEKQISNLDYLRHEMQKALKSQNKTSQ